MRKLTLTLLAISYLSVSGFSQTTQKSIGDAQNQLKACAEQLTNLVTSIETLRTQGLAEFDTEQKQIEADRAAVKKRWETYNEGNAKESNMAYLAWADRTTAKKQLLEEEQAIEVRQLKLDRRKEDFAIRIAQLEKSIAIFAGEVQVRADNLTGQINAMNGKIGGTLF